MQIEEENTNHKYVLLTIFTDHVCFEVNLLQIIDAHVHFPFRSGLKAYVEACEEVGVEKCFMCALPESETGNTQVELAQKEYPNLIKGFAYIDLDRDKPDAVDEFFSKGFTGIKLIVPLKPYDSEGYLPIYERIERCGMPVLFHTGIVSRGTRVPEKGVTSSNMRPIYLETIARSFPNLTLIGAHLGHPWCEEAAVVSFHNPNVFFDICGGHTFFIALTIWERFGYDLKPSKLLFGTDTFSENFQRLIGFWQVLLPQLGLSDEDLKLVFYQNASRILSGGT